jgi:N-acetylglucosamine kinase-like BadF-type ATPase
VRNDSFAALRAGTSRPWGVVLICGEGVNAAGIAPDRRTLKLAGIGGVSGDWGGGHGLGVSALGAAVRARDGRGPRTALERLVPAHFGLQQPIAVARAMRDDVLDERRASELTPILFSAATDGDAVARSIVDLLADELAIMAGAMIRRLNLVRRDVEVVLAGGVFRAEDRGFYERLAAGIRAVAPQARLVRLAALPVLGAALLGLDELRISRTDRARAEARLRRELGAWHPSAAAEPPEELTERGIG